MPAHEPSGRSPRGRVPEERLWQVGFLVGSVVGAAITIAGRQVERSAREAGLVDWRRVESIAIARLRNAPGALTEEQLRAVEGEYADAMARVAPALARHLGTELPGVVDRHGEIRVLFYYADGKAVLLSGLLAKRKDGYSAAELNAAEQAINAYLAARKASRVKLI